MKTCTYAGALLRGMLCAMVVTSALHAANYELIKAFEAPPRDFFPELVPGPDGNFYVATQYGGVNDSGAVFRLMPAGAVSLVASMPLGSHPNGQLAVDPAGNLYVRSWTHLHKITPAGQVSALLDDPYALISSVAVDAAGTVIGSTWTGGAFRNGYIFKLTASGEYSVLRDFDETLGSLNNGAGIVADGAGNFYGYAGSDSATFFRITSSGELTRLASGSRSSGRLIRGADGNIYGTARDPRSRNELLFRLTPAGDYTVLATFTGQSGVVSWTTGPLAQDASGNLYGTIFESAVPSAGAVYRVTADGQFSILKQFTNPGNNPRGGLATLDGVNFFGTVGIGGSYLNRLEIFRITSSGEYTTLGLMSGGKPASPETGLLADGAGNLVGTTSSGGPSDAGTIFKVGADGAYSTLLEFTGTAGARPGAYVVGELNVDAAGNIFGATSQGGAEDSGTLFKVTPAGEHTLLREFPYVQGVPTSPRGVRLDAAGNIFGHSWARLFKWSPSGAFEEFGPPVEMVGSYTGRPLLGDNGTIYSARYGTPLDDDAPMPGKIVRITATQTDDPWRRFDLPSTGGAPAAGLVRDGAGNLYGINDGGGAHGHGTVFKVTPEGGLCVLVHLTGTSGAAPGDRNAGEVLVDEAGNLFCTTLGGGSADAGVVFRVTPRGAYMPIFEFTGYGAQLYGGREPRGRLHLSSDGWLYGTAGAAGPLGGGTVWRGRFGPTPTTLRAADVGTISAQLRANVNPRGEATNVTFEYGTSTEFGSETEPVSLPADGVYHDVETPLDGLTFGAVYHVRAKAVNASGTQYGDTILVPTGGNGRIGAWLFEHFNDAFAPLTDDRDGDGIPALLEYALMRSPAMFDAPPFAVRATDASVSDLGTSSSDLTLTLQRDPERNDVSITVESAFDVAGPWEAIASSVNGAPFTGRAQVLGESGGRGVKTVQIRDVLPDKAVERRFLRVRATH